MELSPEEQKILRCLLKLQRANHQTIARKAGLRQAEVQRLSGWLNSKGLVELRKEEKTLLKLNERGELYLKQKLPERAVLQLIKSGLSSVQELKQAHREAEIGLMWARQQGWVEIKEGKCSLTELGMQTITTKTELELLLEKLKAGVKASELPTSVLELLKKRKLVKELRLVERELSLTQRGKELALQIPKRISYAIGQLTPEILRSKLWKWRHMRKYDVTLPAPKLYAGKFQPYQYLLQQLRNKLVAMGFVEAKGPLVELNFWNCDALFVPSDHPARGIHDVFYVKFGKGEVKDEMLWKRVKEAHCKGWGSWDEQLAKQLILRSQGTAVSARVLANLKPEDLPYKMFSISKVFRPDVMDAKHLIEFEHCEGIVVSQNLNFKHLLGYLKAIAELFGPKCIRFKPAYFPFTEPSVELQVYFEGWGWVEAAGAGMFRPEVTLPLGIDARVLAWGIGVSRLAMLKLGVQDIRNLYSGDLEWLHNKPLCLL